MSKCQQVKLGDIGKIITGKTPPTANPENYGGNIPFITPSDMYGWRDIFCTERYLTEQGVHTVKNNVIPAGAVCVSCIGSDMGKVVIARKRCVTNQQINSIIVNDNFDQHFVYYLLLTQKDVIRSLGKNGTAIPILNKSKFSEIKVSVPPIEIQRKIADVLAAYDDLIENNRKQIKLLEEAAQRLYKEWFIDLRFPGHENTPIVDGIPDGWRMGKAIDFFNITIGKTPPRSESQCFTDGNNGIPWVSISDMGSSGAYIIFTAEGLTADSINKYNVKKVPIGTILLSFKLTLGRVSIATTPCCTNEAIAHFYIDEEWMREYTYLYLKNFEYNTLGNTSSISKAVNSSIIKAMPFILPDTDLISAFSKLTAPIFKKIYDSQQCINATQEARDNLLPKLMNGELEVK